MILRTKWSGQAARRALTTSVAACLALMGLAVTSAAPAVAATNGSMTLDKSLVLDDGVDHPVVSNVAGVQGQTFRYQLAYTCVVNSGYKCTDVTLVDDVPAELELVGTYPDDWTISGNHVEIPIGDIGPGAGTREISVRFATKTSYTANQEVSAVNQAQADYVIANAAGTNTESASANSNPVTVTGVVAPIGGVTAAKSLSPTTAQEFAGGTTTVTLTGKNTGTDTAELVITDDTAAFFNAFDLNSQPTVTAPGSSTGTTIEARIGGSWTTLPTSFPADIDGLRVRFAGTGAGESAVVSFTMKLRDSLPGGGDVVTGSSLAIDNTSTVSTRYADSDIDKSSNATGRITVTGATAGSARLSKTVSPATIAVGAPEPITYTLRNQWSPTAGALGGVGRIVFTDPIEGGDNPFAADVDIDAVKVTWPSTEAATATLVTNCGTTGPVSRTGDGQSIALPCSGDQITSIKLTLTPEDGVYPANASATVQIVTHLQPGGSNESRAVKNDAQVDTNSAYADLSSTATATDISFSIQQPTFSVTTEKRFSKPSSNSKANIVILTSRATASPSNAAVDKLVVQDPPDPTAADNFYNQYDIVSVRPLGCPSGYSAKLEIWDGADWVVPDGADGDACTYTSTMPLTAAEQAVAAGLRITYTRADGDVSTVTVQPQLNVSMRDTDRVTHDPLVVPPYDPDLETQNSWVSSPNCASSTLVDNGIEVASSTLTGSACPTLKRVPSAPSTGGGGAGFSMTKVLGTVQGGSVEPEPRELAGTVFYGRIGALQTGALTDVASVTLADPVGVDETAEGDLVGGYSASVASQVFASATNVQQVTSSAIPAYERATLEGWNVTSKTWVALQTVNGTSAINYTFAASDYDRYGGWRIRVIENPASPGDNPGFLESTTFMTSPLVATVKYQLRSTFRTTVSVHNAGDAVLNNLCYGVGGTPLPENADGTVAGSCSYAFAPYTSSDPEYANDAGRLINDAEVIAEGTYEDDPELKKTRATVDASASTRDISIQSSAFNADIVKSFWKGTIQDGRGETTAARVPMPVPPEVPGSLQERTLRIALKNQTPLPMTLTGTDATTDFWQMFQLVRVDPATLSPTAAGYNTATALTYTVTFGDGTMPFTGTLAQVNALTNLDKVTSVTVVAAKVPGGTVTSPQTVNVNLLVRLRATVIEPDAAVNVATLDADAYGTPFAQETDKASIQAMPSRHEVAASKSVALAPGQANVIDLRPVLNVTAGADNTGDLPVSALVIEDDDDLGTGYGTPSTPATLPANVSSDFWPRVTFEHLTAITYPKPTGQVAVEVLVDGTWRSVGSFPAGTAIADLDAAIDAAGRAAVKGVRATFTDAAGFAVATGARLTFQVRLSTGAPAGTAMTNCSEAGMSFADEDGRAVSQYQNPVCASFTPALGTLKIDVDKSTVATSVLSGDVVPWRLVVTNNGQQAIGLRNTSPLTIIDRLPASLVWDPSVAAVSATFPSPQVTSSFDDDELPAVHYDPATNTLSWTFSEGEALGAGESLTLRFNLRVAAAVSAGSAVVNRAGVTMPSSSACTSGDTYSNGACTDTAQVSVASGGNVMPTTTIDAGSTSQAVSTDPDLSCVDGDPQAYPCVALTPAGTNYTWNLLLQNSGNVNLNSVVILDRLPAVGDVTVQGAFPRGTEWTPQSRGPVSVTAPGLTSGDVTVQYLLPGAADACFDELSTGVACSDWVTLDDGDDLPVAALGLRAVVPYSSANGRFAPGATVKVSWPEKAPVSLTSASDLYDASGTANPDRVLQQWNNFSARVDAGTSLQVSSYKAGAQFDSAALDIRKIIDESTVADPADFGPFSIEVACTYSGSSVYSGTVSLVDSQTTTILGLPSGTRCVLTEVNAPTHFLWAGDENPLTPAGDYTVSYDPAAPAAVTAVLTNSYSGQVVAIDKRVRGTTGDADYGVAVGCTYNGRSLELDPGQAVQRISTTGSGSVTGLPVGAECTVTEDDNGTASSSDAVVAIDGSSAGAGHGTDTASVSFTVPESKPTVVTFTNSYTATLGVTKTVETDSIVPADRFGPFAFEVVCGTAAGPQTIHWTDVRSGDAFDWDTQGGAELLAGSSCRVDETETGNSQSVTVGGADGTQVERTLAQGENQIAAVNGFAAHSLLVDYAQRGDTGEVLRPVFSATCTFQGEDITSLMPAEQTGFTLADGESTALTGLPAGTTCDLVEVDSLGANRVEMRVADDPLTVLSGLLPKSSAEATVHPISTPGTVSFVNTYLALLQVHTTVNEATVLAGSDFGPFTTSVSCVNPDGQSETMVKEGIRDGQTFGWEGGMELLAGAQCTVTETDTSGAQSVTVNGQAAATAQVGPLPQGSTTVEIVNGYDPVALTVSKQVTGTSEAVDRASFELACSYGERDLGDLLETDAFSLEAGQAAVLTGLPLGSACQVQEVDVAGALLTYVDIEGSSHRFEAESETPVAEVTLDSDEIVGFQNVYRAEVLSVMTGIPSTTGPWWLAVVGACLLALGVGLGTRWYRSRPAAGWDIRDGADGS